MTVANTTVELEFSNVVAGTPITVAIQTNGDPVTIRVAYGAERLPATINTDYVIVIAPDLLTFTLTPTASLLDKIDVSGPNIIFVSRMVLLTTDFDQDDAFVREKLVSEFDEVWMALQQITNAASGDVGDAAQDAAAAAASAAAAEVSEDNAETHKVAAQVAAAAASGSADSAIASASSATSSATAAATSATNAANSAIASANSATQAANSVAAIGDPATVPHTDIVQTWTATQDFGAITVSGTAAFNGGGTLGNASGDVVIIKGTTVHASMSALWSSATVSAFGASIFNNMAGTGGVGTLHSGDIMLIRDEVSGGNVWRYNNIVAIITTGLLGLPNI